MPRALFFCNRCTCKWLAWREGEEKGSLSHTLLIPLPTLREYSEWAVGPFLLSFLVRQSRGPAAGAYPLEWVGEDRMASGFVLFCLASGPASRYLQTPGPPERGERGEAAAAATASGGRRAGRCGALLEDPAPSPRRPQHPLPAACGRPRHRRAGHVGASVTPSLTLTHTPALHSCSVPGRNTGSSCLSLRDSP